VALALALIVFGLDLGLDQLALALSVLALLTSLHQSLLFIANRLLMSLQVNEPGKSFNIR